MKRLLLLTPLLLVFAGCGATAKGPHPAAAQLSRNLSLGDVPLRLDVAGLRRRGRVASLDLRLSNRALPGGDSFSIDDTFSRSGDYDLGGVALLDPNSGRELDALADDSDLAFVDVSPGGTQRLSVSFPVPRGDRVDVLVPHFGLFRDVPVRPV